MALNFCELIKDEIEHSTRLYGNEDADLLRRWYKTLTNHYKFRSHYYAMRIIHLFYNIKKGKKILDAGCGLGTESIFCGILGGKVVGIDIQERYIKLAKKRLKYYEKKLNKDINIEFYAKDLFNHFDNYDIIWLNEAISHIHTPEKIIKISYNNLKIGGKLIIADANKMNPYIKTIIKRKRKSFFFNIRDPNSGRNVPQVSEGCYSIPGIKDILLKFFNIMDVYTFGYFPYFIFDYFNNICKKIEENFLRKIPILNLFSAIYLIICVKA